MRKYTILSALIILTVSIAVFLTVTHLQKPDPKKRGSFSSSFSLSLRFISGSTVETSHFLISLQNKSKIDMEIQANESLFEGDILIAATDGNTYELYEKQYLTLLQTSLWEKPIVRLKPNSEITWKLPITRLSGRDGMEIEWERMKGGKAYARMEELAVVGRSFASDNACQESPAIDIP